ncbi:periodic tryptophan protein 2 [Fagus crenata]
MNTTHHQVPNHHPPHPILLRHYHLATSQDSIFLITVDNNRRRLVIHLHRHVILHCLSFENTINALTFSPSGSQIAVTIGKLV